jgi:hypothetical protein
MESVTQQAKAEPSVSEIIASLVNKSGKTCKQIADEAELGKPNMISMLKRGGTKLPLAKIGLFAKAVHTDPARLLKLCLAEYYPDVWSAIQEYLESALTSDELRLVRGLRAATGNPYIACLQPDEKERLEDFLNLITKVTTIH